VPAGLVSRQPEVRAVADLLASASGRPSALLVEGEPGIGKTTLWSAVAKQAVERLVDIVPTLFQGSAVLRAPWDAVDQRSAHGRGAHSFTLR
jgi:MoxR-like ATPase